MQRERVVIYCNTWLVRLYLIISTLSHKRHNFRESYWTSNVCWISLQVSSETFLILRRTERDIQNAYQTSRKVAVILVRFLWSHNFLDKISITTFYENPSSGSRVVSCGPTDRQTDMSHLIVALSNIVKTPKNRQIRGKGTTLLGRRFTYTCEWHEYWS
jgi:hypothetical protein